MPERTVGYVLKGYPRRSELFIASEIWRLEQLHVPVRLFVIKGPEETEHHDVVDRICAEPRYLPDTTSLSGRPLTHWLGENLGAFRPALFGAARQHPVGLGLGRRGRLRTVLARAPRLAAAEPVRQGAAAGGGAGGRGGPGR